MKDSLKGHLAGAGYAALVTGILALFFADKKAELNLYFARHTVEDANQIRKSINETLALAFETKTASDGLLVIANNPPAQLNLAMCMPKQCTAPLVNPDISEDDGWVAIAKKCLQKEVESWDIREEADAYHVCTVKQMNCVQENVMTK